MVNMPHRTGTINLELPWPPSVNHYWRQGNGHFYISPEGRRYKMTVCGLLAASYIQPFDGPVSVTIEAHPPDRRRRDLDNINKAIFDACVVRKGFSAGLYHDDAQVKRIVSTLWDYDAERAGRVLLTVAPWPDGHAAVVTDRVRPPGLVERRPLNPIGEPAWLRNAPASPLPSATVISPIKASPLWQRFAAWWNAYAPT